MFELPVDEDAVSIASSRLQSTTSFSIRRKRDHQGDVICPSVKKFGFCIGYHGLNVDYNNPSNLLYNYRNYNHEKFEHTLTLLKEKFDKQYKQWQIDAWKEKCKETCPFNSKKSFLPNSSMISNQCKMSYKTGISGIHQVKGFLSRNKIINSEMNATSMTGISSFSQTNTARRINHLKPTQSKDDSIFKVPKFIRPGGLKEKSKTLNEWSLTISPDYKLIMTGIPLDSKFLIEVQISRRVNKYTILTNDQEQIHFSGPIKANNTDIPQYIISKFTFGFQDDWEDDIELWKRYIRQGNPENFDWPCLPSEIHDYFQRNEDTLEAIKGSEDEIDLSLLTVNNIFGNNDKEQSQSDEDIDFLPTRKNKLISKKIEFNKPTENNLNLTQMTQSNRNSSIRKSFENYLIISEWLPIYDDKKKVNPIMIRGKITNSQGKTNKEIIRIISIINENQFLSNNEQKYQLKGTLHDPDKVLPSKIDSLCKSGFLNNYNEIIKIWPQLLKQIKNTYKSNVEKSPDLNSTIKKSSRGRILQTPRRFYFENKTKSSNETPSRPNETPSRLSKENFEPTGKKLQSSTIKTEKSKLRNSAIFKRKASDFDITKLKHREMVSLNDVRDTPPGLHILRCLTLEDSEEKEDSFEEEIKDNEPLNRKLIKSYFQRQKKLNNEKNKKQENLSKKKEFKISAKANKLYKELTSNNGLENYLNCNDNEEDEDESLETESLSDIEESD